MSLNNNKKKVDKNYLNNDRKTTTYCEGDSKTSKHPRIYISLKNGTAVCNYCRKKFGNS
jgi:uncharacterized Zn-finger protein